MKNINIKIYIDTKTPEKKLKNKQKVQIIQ